MSIFVCGYYEYLIVNRKNIFIDGAACWNNVVKTIKRIKRKKRETTNKFRLENTNSLLNLSSCYDIFETRIYICAEWTCTFVAL